MDTATGFKGTKPADLVYMTSICMKKINIRIEIRWKGIWPHQWFILKSFADHKCLKPTDQQLCDDSS